MSAGRRVSADPREALAAVYADVVLDNLRRPYPYASHHAETSPEDRPSPRELHPSFHTSFDWHSSEIGRASCRERVSRLV